MAKLLIQFRIKFNYYGKFAEALELLFDDVSQEVIDKEKQGK